MVKERFKEFIQGFKDDDGRPIYWNMTKKMIERDETSLMVNFNDLEVWDPTISEKVLDQPDSTFKKLETILKTITEKEEPGYVDKHDDRFYVRVYNLPKRSRRDIRKIRAEHIGKLVTFDAVVTKTTEIKPLLTIARFKCVQCGMETPRLQDEGRYNPPVRCSNDQCNKAGPFKLITTSCKFMDFQKLIVQERPEDLPAGHMPEGFVCYLFDDLVDLVRPGDRVTASGTLRISGGYNMQRGRFAAFGKYMECNSIIKESEDYMNVEITEEDEEAIKEFAKDKFVHRKLWGSIAPAIHGYDMVKKAISLMLLGGTYKELEDKTKFRGEPNILLIGDPGVGKSKILKYIADLAPRGIYTSGKGTSAAGLCVSGDSPVFLSNTSLPISQIVEKEFEKGDIQRYNNRIEYRKNTRDDLSVFHSSNLKLSTRQISRVWRIESPQKLIKITSRTGRELKLTAETGMLSIERDVGLVWKPAKFIRPGNRVATARSLSTVSTKELPTIYELITDYPGEITLLKVENTVTRLVERITNDLKISLRDLAVKLDVSESTLYNWRNENLPGSISLRNFKNLCNILDEDVEAYLPETILLQVKKGQTIILPRVLDENWFYIMGLIIGDGRISIDKRREGYGGATIGFSNRDPDLLNEYTNFFENLGLKVNSSKNAEERPIECRIWSVLIYHIFTKFGLSSSPKSAEISLNNDILYYKKSYLNSLLRGIYDTDGWICTRQESSSHISFASTSKALIQFVQNALLNSGIVSFIRERDAKTAISKTGNQIVGKNTIYNLSFSAHADFIAFSQNINFNHPKKKKKLDRYCQITKKAHRNVDNVPGAYNILKEIMDFYGYTSRELVGSKAAFSPCSIQNRDISRNRLSMILKKIENQNWYNHRLKLKEKVRTGFYQEIQEILSQESIIMISNLSKEQLYEYFVRKGRNPKIPVGIIISLFEKIKTKLEPETRDYWSNLIEMVRKKHEECQKKYDLLKNLCDSDIFWDEVTSVEVVESIGQHVYDLTIPKTHNFIVNGFVVHNTAAVLRDPETKELALEAGALVLADRGVAIIDEFDKMDADDRGGLHEAMEAHTVSIAKAGIVATLNARCSILAAANPKLGRWDSDKDLNYNLNLPPAIISRFDLIFPLVDEPDEKEDRERAMFILTQHQKSALADEPPADAVFIRKFIAFARQSCHPKLTDEAIQRILEFYLKLRKQSLELDPTSGKPKSIAITPRQLEAIIRLSEAHAKVALRDKVTYEDSEAAIKLMEETLRMVATDPLTGRPDIDRVTSGRSSSTRSKLKTVNDIIEELTKDGDAASIKEIIRRAADKDLKKDAVEDIIHDLVRDGVYYEPSPGKVKRIN
ncbi:MAG: LAGLIDADG family homing endonuclease [Candidatus Hodarchaeales archaeon]|jgi:replicative DNA helicase Mcm